MYTEDCFVSKTDDASLTSLLEMVVSSLFGSNGGIF
jgi:hypothetical protein